MDEVLRIYADRDGKKTVIPLYKGIDDLYLLASITNKIMDELRMATITWLSKEVYDKLNLEILVEDSDWINAFATKYNGKYIIALSRGLLLRCHDEIISWIESPNYTKVYKLSDENKDVFVEDMYREMIFFVIAHELGHIVNGHIDARDANFCYIDELSLEKTEDNWNTQLREYNADCFATRLCSWIKMGHCKKNKELTLSQFDILGMEMFLTFNLLSYSRKQDFADYMDKNIEDIDHPHPGIRMMYCIFVMADELLMVWEEKEVKEIIAIAYDGIIRTDKYLFDKEKYRECIYSVAGTQKGAEHIMSLINDWNEVADEYQKYAFIPMRRTENLESQLVFVDDDGNVLVPNFNIDIFGYNN